MEQYVVFGDFAVNKAAEGNWSGLARLFNDDPNTIGKREFKTEDERNAYIKGLDDAIGWMDCWPLSKEELEKLSRHVRLSDIDDLEGSI